MLDNANDQYTHYNNYITLALGLRTNTSIHIYVNMKLQRQGLENVDMLRAIRNIMDGCIDVEWPVYLQQIKITTIYNYFHYNLILCS